MKKILMITGTLFILVTFQLFAQSDRFEKFEEKFSNTITAPKKEFFEQKNLLTTDERITYYCTQDSRYRVAVKQGENIWILVWPKNSDMVDVSIVQDKTLIASRRYYISGIPDKNASGTILKDKKFSELEKLFFE
jgi:uncharacterized protein YpmB